MRQDRDREAENLLHAKYEELRKGALVKVEALKNTKLAELRALVINYNAGKIEFDQAVDELIAIEEILNK